MLILIRLFKVIYPPYIDMLNIGCIILMVRASKRTWVKNMVRNYNHTGDIGDRVNMWDREIIYPENLMSNFL